MKTCDDRSNGTRLNPAEIAALAEQVRGSRLSRRHLLRRGLDLGLAAPAAGLVGSRAVSAARLQTPPARKGGDGTLIVTSGGDPFSFNPNFQNDMNGFAPCCNIYNSLMSLNGTYDIIPELATAWEVAADRLSIAFTLADGAMWHDGRPVTSADVKYTFEQIVADPAAPANGLLGELASVETPDDKMAVCRLNQPSPSILGYIAWYGTSILPAHLYQGTDWTTNPANQAPVGSGPFKFVSYAPGASIELAANHDYFGEGPYLDKLIFSIIPDANTALLAFLNGEVDVMLAPNPPNSQVPALQQTEGVKVALNRAPAVHYFGFNLNKEPFTKPEVRRAIAQAVDRPQLVDTALGGMGSPATSFYTSAIAWATNTDPEAQAPAFDLDAAKAALDAAGYPANGGSRFRVQFPHYTFSPDPDIATVVKQQLAALDIDVEPVGLEASAYVRRMEAGDFDIGLIDGIQGPDPAQLRLRFGTGGVVNHWFYSNPEVDTLLDEGDAAADQEMRAEKYKQIQAILARELPIVPLTNAVVPYAYSARVSGGFFDHDDPVAGRIGLNRFTLTRIAKA